jgi:hypothetical protein
MAIIIFQSAKTDIFKNIIKILSGKIDYIPITFNNKEKNMSISINLPKISYFIEFTNINYLSDGFDEDLVIVPVKLQDIELIYKSLGASKIKSLQIEYITDHKNSENFILKYFISDSSLIERDIEIERNESITDNIESFENFSEPVILNDDTIIIFDRIISEIDKNNIDNFKIHYIDKYFYISYNNLKPISFGFEWIIDPITNRYNITQNHVCNKNICKDIIISKNYCKKIFNKLKILNKKQINISFKKISNTTDIIRITANIDEIGKINILIYVDN